jgi:hypothetical protein
MTDPLNEHSGGSPENAPSGGRRGDRAEGMRLVFADRPGPLMLLLEVDTWPELRLEGRPVPGVLPAPLSVEDAVELERLTALSSEELDAELAGLRVDPAPFLERMRAFVAALEPEHLPECSGWTFDHGGPFDCPGAPACEAIRDGTVVRLALEPAALSEPGDRPTTAREAEVMARGGRSSCPRTALAPRVPRPAHITFTRTV